MTMNPLERAAEWIVAYGVVAQLAANLILICVTAWYAFLTMRLARSSIEATRAAQSSASSAENAALSAKTSALASISSIGVKYSCVPLYVRENQQEMFCGIALRGNGPAAFIHSVHLDSACTSHSVQGKPGSQILVSVAENVEIMPLNTLPRRLQPGAVMHFYLSPDAQRECWVTQLNIGISYSFDEYVVMNGLPLNWYDSNGKDIMKWEVTSVPGRTTAYVGRPPIEGEFVPTFEQ